MTCLSEKVTEVEALTERLSRADGTVIENAVLAASALSPLDRCSDVPLLKAVVQPPTDAATRKRVYDLRADLARLDAEKNAGHCAAAEAIAGRLIPQAREVGYQPLLADVLYGAAAWDCVAPALALQRLREAYFAGLASRKDETAAAASILLADMLAGDVQQVEDGRVWLNTGKAMLARIGAQPLLNTWLLQAERIFFDRDGDHAAAIRAWSAARDAKTKLLGADHPDVGMSGIGLGNMLQEAGRYEEALAIDASTAEMLRRSLGADHPWVARDLNNEGEVLNILHRYAEARSAFERCVDIWTKTGAPASLLAYGQTGLGVALVGEGRGGEAVAPLGRALASREEAHEPAEVLGETRFALARALWTQPRARARALALARQARADYAQAKVAPTVATIDAWLATPGAKPSAGPI